MSMYDEIKEIPAAARRCQQRCKDVSLPLHVPYIGMGSSYFAPLTLFYAGVPVSPFIASEYFHYLHGGEKRDQAVLISQSGESSETLWCMDLFRSYHAIVNDPGSSLTKGKNISGKYFIYAGQEEHSATKSYVNTLITLYCGFGIDPEEAVKKTERQIAEYEKTALTMAKRITERMNQDTVKGIYIVGSGPNIGTAHEAALILSETTKIPFIGMPMAQYDHGPKETARDSIVIAINPDGKNFRRTKQLLKKVQEAGAGVFALEEPGLPEILSPLTIIIPLNFLAYFLAVERGVSSTFTVGDKITRTERDL